MLKFVKIEDPSLKFDFVSSFDPKTTSFICSDIKNKDFLKQHFVKKHNTEDAVLRANEFYLWFFKTLNKKWTLKPDSFVKKMLDEFLESQSKSVSDTKPVFQSQFEKSTKHLIGSQVFFKWFQFVFPFFLQESTLLKEWHQDKKLFPKEWIKIFEDFFELLVSSNTLYESAIKSYLWSQSSVFKKHLKTQFFEKPNLVVDLAFSMNLCEKDLYKEISQFKEVYILSPVLKEKNFFQNKAFDFYGEWEKEIDKKNIIPLNTLYGLSKQNRELNPSIDQKNFSKPSYQSIHPSSYPSDPNHSQSYQYKEKKENLATTPSFFYSKSHTKQEEIEKAVAQVSKWLHKGVHPEDIVIHSPFIETDWFVLKYYLEKQSIPYKKTKRTGLIEFPEVKYFLSALRFHLDLFDFQDLENYYFYKNSKKDFFHFKKKHFEVLNKSKIKRNPQRQRDSEKKVSGLEFVDWARSFYPVSQLTAPAVFQILKNRKTQDKLAFKSWFHLLEAEILLKDIELEKESSFGISCLSFNAFHSVPSSYVILLGLNESCFKETNLLQESALSSLLHDLGFGLDFKLAQEKEKSLLWFLQSSHHKEIHFSHSLHDLEGNTENKALLFMFLEQYYPQHNLQKTDDIKEYNKTLSSLTSKTSKGKNKFLNEDNSEADTLSNKDNNNQMGKEQDNKNDKRNMTNCKLEKEESINEKNIKQRKDLRELLKAKSPKQQEALEKAFFDNPHSFFHPSLESLSVSQLKSYYDCPFKYAANKIFYVKEEQNLNQELSPLIKGVTVHKLFNLLLLNYPSLNITEQEKEDLIHSLIPEDKEFVFKDKQKILLKTYLKKLIEEFLIKEKQQKKTYPSIKPIAFEAKLTAFWNQEKGQLDKQGKYLFKGSIDRIDQEGENPSYIVRDYKASLNHLTHISSWLKHYDIQLLFYAQALEKGLVENLKPGEVSALFYSAYNEGFKAKAFVKKEAGLDDLILGARNSYLKSKEIMLSSIEKLNRKTKELVKQIEKGDFAPKPRDKKLCSSCAYKQWCRVDYV